MKECKSFSSIAQLLQEAAEREYETLLERALRELEGEYQVKLAACFEKQRKEIKIKAAQMAVELFQRSDIAGVEVRIRS